MAAPISHHTFLGGEAPIHYRQIGDKPSKAVFLHGFPQTGRLWERTGSLVAERYAVIAQDLRGAGESGRPPAGYDKKTMARDVHTLVASLGTGPIRLVGHDIGAAVAYAYAAQWPDEVSHLTMIEMLLPGFGLEALYAIRHPGEFAHMPFFMVADLPEWLISGREAAFLDWFIRNMLADQSAFGPNDITAYVGAYARPGALRAASDAYRAFWQDADDNRIFGRTKLPMPVLAIGADGSLEPQVAQSLGPLTDHLQSLAFEHCGQFVPDEQPERLARELMRFFDGERATPGLRRPHDP